MPVIEYEISRVYNYCPVKAKVIVEIPSEDPEEIKAKLQELHNTLAPEVDRQIQCLKAAHYYEGITEAKLRIPGTIKALEFELAKGDKGNPDLSIVDQINNGIFNNYPLFDYSKPKSLEEISAEPAQNGSLGYWDMETANNRVEAYMQEAKERNFD